ncbi:MAG: ABC transporter ATP-binding protein [Bacteroidales bacterium]|jgi:ABC-type multidrug transport system fused ATPase/permease subunit|nr:ABC transporter ATP-binding protein [Bacteroidales bacterium]MDI9592110.1 ABC transporter ATP-binding protein [Bacteroidota bacterium]HOF80111.1 ABC transporter ATP-binding protein [Bacteroidales bacterium]HOR75431.1 ABC transporter ATP-binding protein [Bacteroidales bacterium]HPL10842.1 ABC transporter ATP-binding protein [Bacteroidales bacterium]
MKSFIPVEYQKLRKLFSRSDKFKIVAIFVMMLGSIFLEVIGVGIIPAFIAIVANPSMVLENKRFGWIFYQLGITDARSMLIFGAIALIGIFLVKSTYLLLFKFIESRFTYNRRYTLSLRIMTAYMQAPYTFYLTRNSSELLRNTTGEVDNLINQVLNPTLIILKESMLALSLVIFLFIIEPLITFFVILILGGSSLIFLAATQKRVKYFGNQALKYREEMIKTARQAFGGIKDARVLNREKNFIEAYRVVAYESSLLQRKRAIIVQMPKPIVETFAVIGILLIALVMHIQGRPIADIIPIIALFGAAIVKLMPALFLITQQSTEVRYNIASVNPVHDDLMALQSAQKKFHKDRSQTKIIELQDSIQINNLHYQYPNSTEQALRGVTLEIPKGKAVAFVGPSGAGKTTIADVLLGLLEPQQGKIEVDGKDVFENISAWQYNIGYIPQFIYLSDDTMRRNIGFGLSDKEIDEEKIQKAVDLSQLRELVESLPKGLDAIVGERGTRLSGGQRQRVGIARALYHNPQVLVMDEATSALDNITEQLIIKAIEDLKGERTVIMIAHRLTTVMNCDIIFYMEEGKIVDQGTYNELIKRNKKFREMALENTKEK